MKTGIKSSAYFHLYDYEQGFKTLRAHGYDAVDYQEFMSMDSPLYSMGEDELSCFLTKVANAAEENDAEIYQVHAIWPTAGDDTEEGRQKSLVYYRRSVLGAKYLRCKYLVIHPRMEYGWANNGTSEEFVQSNIAFLKELLPFAKQHGIILCLENMPFRKGSTFSTVKEWVAILDGVNDEHAKACLDTGHLNVMGEDAYTSVLALKDHLAVMHVHDNRWGTDMHLLPYQGTLDWDGLLKGLKEIAFDGCFSLETSIDERTPEAVKEDFQKALAALAKEMAKRIGK